MKKQPLTLSQAFGRKYWEKRNLLLHLKNYNEGKEVIWSDLTRPFLVGWTKYIKGKTSPNTARQYNKLLSSVLNDYNKVIELPESDYKEVLRLKAVDSIHVSLTNDEIQKLIDYSPEDDREHTVKNQFLLSCFTGMRYSDVIYLNENNIQNNIITYYAKKTSKTIRVPISPIIRKLLEEKKTTIHHSTIFNRIIKRICKKAGINTPVKTVRAGIGYEGQKWEYIASHSARRTYATELLKATKDIFTVSRLMGHSDIKQTQGYICTCTDSYDAVIEYSNQFSY